MFFIDTAYASPVSGSASQHASGFSGMVGIVLLLIVGYFFMLRPQMKKQKEHRNLVSSVSDGDEVITSGGIVGKVTKVEDHFFNIEIAPNTVIKIQKSAVGNVLPKGTMQAATA